MRDGPSPILFQTRHVCDAFTRAAATYEANAALQRQIARGCVAALAARLTTARPRVLDVGAGTGYVASEASALDLDWNLFALDLSAPMCQQAARYSQHVLRADMARLPFHHQTFDALISSLAIQWAPNPATVLNAFAHATRPAGCAVVATFGPNTLRELAETFESIDGNRRVTAFPSRDRLIQLATRASWRITACDDQTLLTHHPNLTALMRSLKAIGATDHRSARRRGLTAPGLFNKASTRYPKTATGITATWQVLTLTLEKPN